MTSAGKPFLASNQTYGHSIAPITATARYILYAKQMAGQNPQLSKQERIKLKDTLKARDQLQIINGINFSRAQGTLIRRSYEQGERLEFETLGPYLADYVDSNGIITPSNLIPEDLIGFKLAATLQEVFPNAHAVSLYDDYNRAKGNQESSDKPFSKKQKDTFKHSLFQLLKTAGVSTTADQDIEYPLLIPESAMVDRAEKLVEYLDSLGYIQRQGGEIVFVNKDAENPLHQQFNLRSKAGKWLCEALDTATYFEKLELNKLTTHIVILPEYMKDQQDRVWEILRVLGILPEKYHNLFYTLDQTPEEVSNTVRLLFSKTSPDTSFDPLGSLTPSWLNPFTMVR